MILDYMDVVERDISLSKDMKVHLVSSGECFEEIGNKYGMDWRVIFNFNKIFRKDLDPSLLFPGDIIYIPTKKDLSLS